MHADFTGSVNSLNGDCPNLTLTVGLVTVQTSGATKFKGGGCNDLNPGNDAHVTGTLQLNGIVAADQVTFKKGHDD